MGYKEAPVCKDSDLHFSEWVLGLSLYFFFKFLDRAANIQQIAFFLLNKTDTLELPLLVHMLYYIDFHYSPV